MLSDRDVERLYDAATFADAHSTSDGNDPTARAHYRAAHQELAEMLTPTAVLQLVTEIRGHRRRARRTEIQ